MMKEYFFYLMLYSFIGWCCESIFVSIGQKKVVNSGFMTGPFCPIYGFGAVFTILLLTPLIQHPVLVFLLGMLVTSVLEYFTSWLMEVTLHTKWWDYSHYRFHINGRVCLINSILFGLMSIVLLYGVHPHIIKWVESLSSNTLFIIDISLLIYLVIDFSASLSQFISFRHELDKFEAAIAEIKERLRENNEYDLHEKLNEFFESKDNPQLIEFRNRLHEHYTQFRENRRFANRRLRKAFPHMTFSPKREYKPLVTKLRERYENEKKK